MVNETIILIVQAMQLPVVALIFLFTLNSRIANAININQDRFQFIGDIRRIVNKKNPLRYIAIGLLFNFIYLLLKIGTNPKVNFIQIDESPLHSLTVLFDILTTYFFLLGSLPDLIISNESNFDNTKRAFLRKGIILKKRLIFFIITLITIGVVWYSWQTFSWTFYLFDFVGYLLVSIYLFKQIHIRDVFRQNIYSNYFVFAGFFIWAVLQLLTPIGDAQNWDEKIINLIGYSASTFGKSLILYGLNDFSIRIIRTANVELEVRNNRLNQKVKSINALQGLINTISNSQNLYELSTNVVHHLTNKIVFDFDYAVFSEVDYLKQRIIYKNSKTVTEYVIDPDKWVSKDGIPFEDHDILAFVVKKREVIHVYKNSLDGEEFDIDRELSVLNRIIYDKYNHSQLNRFFIPVLKLNGESDNINKVVAIIEAGYYIPNEKHNILKKIFQQGELNIYLDNCTQVLERIANQNTDNSINQLINQSDERAKDDPIDFLKRILISMSSQINYGSGFFVLIPLNKELQDEITFIQNGINDSQLKNIKKSFKYYLQRKYNEIDKLEINSKRISSEYFRLLKAKSLFIKDIKIHNYTSCFLLLFSEDSHFFNKEVESYISKVSENIGLSYREKKFHKTVTALLTPDNALTDLEANIAPVIKLLQEYFESPFIAIWMKEDFENYGQRYATQELKNCCTNFGERRLPISSLNLLTECNIIDLNTNEETIENSAFWNFGKQNSFVTLIQKPIKTTHQEIGFVNLYFKNIIDLKLPHEDLNFLNLAASKIYTNIQIHNLVNTFREISESFTRNNLNETLQVITDSALSLLNADPVILFRSNDGRHVFFKDITYAIVLELKHPKDQELFRNKINTNVELAEIIIENNKNEYFDNTRSFRNYISKHEKKHIREHFPTDEGDFWDREEIRSMAAVPLVNKSGINLKPLGVLFINFRTEITFSEEIKKIIETFAAFAAGSISIANNFQRNRQYLLKNLKLTKPMLVEAILRGELHDSNKSFEALHRNYEKILEFIENKIKYNHDFISTTEIKTKLKLLSEQFIELTHHFNKVVEIYKPTDEPIFSRNNLSEILIEQIEISKADLSKKNIKIDTSNLHRDIYIDCDRSQIGLTILNILNNASYALSIKGNLTIKLKEDLKGNEVSIEIIDDGSGIPVEISEAIFEPFITQKDDGSGLGLSMSRYVVEINHNGKINGKTIVRDGKKETNFKIVLPIHQQNKINTEENEK